MTLRQRYELVENKVAQACDACGRNREGVRIIAVSKTVDLDAVEEAIAVGVHDFGENRPAELLRKFEAFPQERWHVIGNIQSRQLPSIVGRACLIHSLYERFAGREGRHRARRSDRGQRRGGEQAGA